MGISPISEFSRIWVRDGKIVQSDKFLDWTDSQRIFLLTELGRFSFDKNKFVWLILLRKYAFFLILLKHHIITSSLEGLLVSDFLTYLGRLALDKPIPNPTCYLPLLNNNSFLIFQDHQWYIFDIKNECQILSWFIG